MYETKGANLEYLTEYNNRTNDDAQKAEVLLVGEKVKDVRTNLDKILNYLDIVTPVNKNKALIDLYAELELIIENTNAIVKARETRKNKGEGDETE